MPGKCRRCLREVYFAEEKIALGNVWHEFCFSCYNCRKLLNTCNVTTHEGELYCQCCYSKFYKRNNKTLLSEIENRRLKEGKNIKKESLLKQSREKINNNITNVCNCCNQSKNTRVQKYPSNTRVNSEVHPSSSSREVQSYYNRSHRSNQRTAVTQCASNCSCNNAAARLPQRKRNSSPSCTPSPSRYQKPPNQQELKPLPHTFSSPAASTDSGTPPLIPPPPPPPPPEHQLLLRPSRSGDSARHMSVTCKSTTPTCCCRGRRPQTSTWIGRAEVMMPRPDTPLSRPDSPLSRPDTPVSRPITPISRPGTPVSRPFTPPSRPYTPSAQTTSSCQAIAGSQCCSNSCTDDIKKPSSSLRCGSTKSYAIRIRSSYDAEYPRHQEEPPRRNTSSRSSTTPSRRHNRSDTVKTICMKESQQPPCESVNNKSQCCCPFDVGVIKYRRNRSSSRNNCFGGGFPCKRCGRKVYHAEMMIATRSVYHNCCFSCYICRKPLEVTNFFENKDNDEIFCKYCYIKKFGPQGYGYGNRPTLQTP